MNWSVLFVCCFTSVLSQSCRTPLGESSRCISLNDCPTLLGAFQRRPLPSSIINFLRQSQCGFDGYTPTVCCGTRLPNDNPEQQPPPQQSRPGRPAVSAGTAPSVREDSQPAPSGQCGADSNGDRIYGGEFTDLDEFPWMALLGYRTRTGSVTYQCGGVLINKRYVLTAAHCVTGEILTKVGTLVSARLGEYDTQTDTDCIELGGKRTCADPHEEIPVDRAIPHSGFNQRNVNRRDDIALVRLAQRATYNPYVQPICLVDGNTRLSTGDDVFVAGWGKTLSGSSSPIKLKLRLPIFDKASCANIYLRNQAVLTDNQLCAGGEFAKDSCRGDSGGPLMRITNSGTWEVYGIVSFGRGCGIDGVPGVYTSVPSYVDWIRSTIRSSNT